MKFQLHPIINRVERGRGRKGQGRRGRGKKEEEEGRKKVVSKETLRVTNLTVQRPVGAEKSQELVLELLT